MIPDILSSFSEPNTSYRKTLAMIESSQTLLPISSRSRQTPSNLKTLIGRPNGTNLRVSLGHERINAYYRNNWHRLNSLRSDKPDPAWSTSQENRFSQLHTARRHTLACGSLCHPFKTGQEDRVAVNRKRLLLWPSSHMLQ